MSELKYDIVIQEADSQQLREHLLGDLRVENAAYLFCGRSVHPKRVKLLVKDLVPLVGDDFIIQSDNRLQISPTAVARAMKRARLNNQCIVLAHSHPLCDDQVDFSWVDDEGDRQSFGNFYQRVPAGPHASLVFGQRAMQGRVWFQDLETSKLDSIKVVGSTLKKFAANGRSQSDTAAFLETHERQVRAFGSDGQARISKTSVAIVGVGGTGSLVAEQLMRLGVCDITVIDDDQVQASNTSRIYNSTLQDASTRTPKVEVVARHAKRVGLGTNICSIAGNITDEAIALELRNADIVFCCTDNQWSRAILNQYAYQYLTPVIDMGNKIAAERGIITAANGRVSVVAPGNPCLWCTGILDAKRIAEESLPSDKRESLAQEGYVSDLNAAAPSVIFLNTVVAGLAMGEFVNLVTGFMGRAYNPQLTYYPLTGEVKSTVYESHPTCTCATNKYTALGDCLRLPCT